MRKTRILFAAALLLLAALAPSASAAEEDAEERTALSDTMYYDWNTHDYVYPVSGALGEVHSGAADGMVLTAQTYIEISRDAPVSVYRDGEPYDGDLSAVNAAGEYVVSATALGQTRRLFRFTLVGAVTNAVHTFEAPDGFYILTAERDEEDVYENRYTLDMEPEGAYNIEYSCGATEAVYTLQTEIDRTAPSLSFDAAFDQQGRARSAVTFTGLAAGESVSLYRDGEAVEVAVQDGGGTIPEPGNYRLYAYDAAGNVSQYSFIILRYFNIQSIAFFLLIAAVLASAAVYVVVRRKRLKII